MRGGAAIAITATQRYGYGSLGALGIFQPLPAAPAWVMRRDVEPALFAYQCHKPKARSYRLHRW